MKRSLLLLLSVIASAFFIFADDYQITALTSPTINIGGKTLKKGDRFSDRGAINWSNDRQSMEVKNLSTGRLHRLSPKAMKTKWDSKSVADFIAATSKGSTRGGNGKVLFEKSPNKDKFSERRLALVIGNSDYETQSYLKNAQKDATDVAATLRDLGFDVIEAYECSYDEMKHALALMAEKSGDYDVAVFYYAGHGLQDEGVNYLIPIEAKLEMRSELKECLNADDVLYSMEHSGVPERIAFFDACRNIKRSWNRSSEQGLARMEGNPGSSIMFSTSSGNVAFDGEGDNSPFATALMSNIIKTGVGFAETMAAVTRDTYNLTDRRQTPLQVGTLLSNFAFNAAGVVSAGADIVDAVKSKSRPTDDYGSISTRPSRPAIAQPQMTFDADIAVSLRSCKRSGNNLILTLMLENRGRKDIRAIVASDENGHKTGAFDNEGNEYVGSEALFIAGGMDNFYTNPYVPLPVGRAVKLEMKLCNFSRTASILPVTYINFRDTGNGEPYGIATLEIRNIPVGFNAGAMPETDARVSINMSTPDVEVSVSDARRIGNGVAFSVTFTNNSRKTLNAAICDREPCAGYTYCTQYITSDGDVYDKNNFLITKGNSSDSADNISLPPGVPVKINVRFKEYPTQNRTVKYIQFSFRGIDSTEVYGIGALTIENLPIR